MLVGWLKSDVKKGGIDIYNLLVALLLINRSKAGRKGLDKALSADCKPDTTLGSPMKALSNGRDK